MGLPLPIVVSVLVLVPSCPWAVGREDDNVVYVDPMQMQTAMSIQRPDEILQSIHQKLLQHTETLERIMAVVQNNEELTKSIIESLNEKLEEPETHGRIKIYRSSRRSNNENEELPIVKYGKDIVKYGKLLKSVIMTDISRDPEELVEEPNKPVTETNKIV